MGSITFQVVGDASIGTKTKTYTVSNADVNRFVSWATDTFATAPTLGNPSPAPLTATQALAAWADWIMTQTKQRVIARETTVAANALPPPPPFVVS